MSLTRPDTLALAFIPFALSMSFTPGPNNLMLASAGARFGFKRTLPHIAGVVLGCGVLTLLVGLGVAGLIAAVPVLYLVMKYASVAYLLYLAWRIARAETKASDVAQGRPMSFLQAASFQWINPKAWIVALSAVSAYTDPARAIAPQIALIIVVLSVVNMGSTSTWTAFGRMIRRYLTTPRRRMGFNMFMGTLLALSVIPVLIER